MNVHPELILYLESKEDALVLRLIYMVLYFDMEGVSSSSCGYPKLAKDGLFQGIHPIYRWMIKIGLPPF